MGEFANKHPVAFVALVVVGLYAGLYLWTAHRVGRLVPGQTAATGAQGIATGEPYSPVTAYPSSWGSPVSVAAGSGAAAGALDPGGVPPWDRLLS